MKSKFLALMLMGVMALSACTPAETMDSDSDMIMDDSSMEETRPADGEEAPEVVEESGVVLAEFNQSDYDAAIGEGKDVFLDYYAAWCPTCVANSSELEAALKGKDADNLAAFRVNFDTDDAIKAAFGINSQSSYVFVPGGDVDAFELLGPGLFKEADFADFIQ